MLDVLAALAAAHGLRLAVLDDRANAAGEALGLELAPLQILEYETVGMAACVTSRGGLVHPQLPPDEVAALGERFGVALRHGTVNFGLPLVGAGLIATPHGAICGRATTGIELGRVEEGLGLL